MKRVICLVKLLIVVFVLLVWALECCASVGDKISVEEKDKIRKGVRRRLQDDLAAVREALKSIGPSERLERELTAIEKEIPKLETDASEDFRTIFPMNALHRRIFSVQAAVWREKGIGPIVAWQKNRWDMLSPTEIPRGGGAKIDVAMMSNEFRGAAFNISNAGESLSELRMSIVGLPGGVNPKYITVHDVLFTDTKSGVPIAAAMPNAKNAGDGYMFKISSGMTRQVWLTFNLKDVVAGEYQGRIVLEPVGIRIPIRLKIYPFTLPEKLTLHLGGWDYTDQDYVWSVTLENRAALIKHLREHFVDMPWAQCSVMPYGKYDKQGNMVEEPHVDNFKKWIERWQGARLYYVYIDLDNKNKAIGYKGEKIGDFEMGTAAFKKAVGSWITWWVNKLKEWDIKPEQLGLLLVDEMHSHEEDNIFIEYAKIIRKAQPQVVIWEDPIWREPWKALPKLFELCDALCPQMAMWITEGKRFADFYLNQCKAGKELWFYSCNGPGKLLDPYSYHRMQQWFCWKYDAKGSCFWSFADSRGPSSWNEYISTAGAFTPVFLDKDSVTCGKHMEAIREGMEDYEYLRMLRDRIDELVKKNVQGKVIDSAKKLLGSATDRVTACMTKSDKIKWDNPKDRSIADAVRVEVLEMLLKLNEM